jgi:hypothetical protein
VDFVRWVVPIKARGRYTLCSAIHRAEGVRRVRNGDFWKSELFAKDLPSEGATALPTAHCPLAHWPLAITGHWHCCGKSQAVLLSAWRMARMARWAIICRALVAGGSCCCCWLLAAFGLWPLGAG